MINPEFRDVEAERVVLESILPDVQAFMRDVVRSHAALQASCTLINSNERPKLQLDFLRPDKQPLSEMEKKTLHTFPSLLSTLRLFVELDWVIVPRLDNAYCYLFWAMTKGVVRKGPQLGPQKVY